jgi:hypothetical protein
VTIAYCTDVARLSADGGPGSVQLELAKAVEHLPGQCGMPGGYRYELKYDGLIFAV